jgi:S1-C subfamily serine protease
MSETPFALLSESIEAAAAAASALVAAVTWTRQTQISGLLIRPGVLVTSEQSLGDADVYEAVLPGGGRVPAALAGRDPATNVAVLRLDPATPGSAPGAVGAGEARGLGALVLAIGSDGEGGATARLGGIEVLGPAWESRRGGRIDRLIRLGVRLPPAAEGGPVIDARGAVLGMSTFGPRRGVMVIPTATIQRAVDQALSGAGMARGWLGVGLHEVELPRDLAERVGAAAGLMVVALADRAPAAGALLPGDILTALDGRRVTEVRDVAALLGPETVGRAVVVAVVRGGVMSEIRVTVAARPGR